MKNINIWTKKKPQKSLDTDEERIGIRRGAEGPHQSRCRGQGTEAPAGLTWDELCPERIKMKQCPSDLQCQGGSENSGECGQAGWTETLGQCSGLGWQAPPMRVPGAKERRTLSPLKPPPGGGPQPAGSGKRPFSESCRICGPGPQHSGCAL